MTTADLADETACGMKVSLEAILLQCFAGLFIQHWCADVGMGQPVEM